MRLKAIRRLLAACLFLIVFHADVAVSATQNPENFVKSFYAWYFTENIHSEAIFHDTMYAYFDKNVVDYIRYISKISSEDYPAKASTGAAVWVNVKTMVGKAVPMAHNIFIIPVNFHLKNEDVQAVVFVQETEEGLKIIKISDAYPYR